MKPATFRYLAPARLDDALESLAEHDGMAKVLAGGQSLVPAMNFRLATPEVLVDINRIGGHDTIAERGSELTVGMLARHARFETAVTEDSLGTLMSRTARFVGHLPIRTRGTLVGSLAHADPAAEWSMVALALDATIVARSASGQREIGASEFFTGPFTTALADDEILTEVRFPLIGRAGSSVREKSHTAGDFATVAAMAVVGIDGGVIQRAHVGLAGVEGTPVRATSAESALMGAPPESDAFRAAGEAAAEGVTPIGDTLASPDYKRHLVAVLVERALNEAAREAA